jgi:hypothetical protein
VKKMPEQKENQQSLERIGYADSVKEAILSPLEKGTSVLQHPSEGLRYISNYDTGSIPQGMNQMFFQETMKEKGYKIPFYSTFDQAISHGFSIKRGEKSVPLSTWSKVMRYDQDIPRKDAEGHIVKDDNGRAVLEHVKGEAKLNANGDTFSGHTFYNCFFIEQQDLSFKTFRNNARTDEKGNAVGGFVPASDILTVKEHIDLPIPFVDRETKRSSSKPGEYYKAKNDSAIELYCEHASRYLNSTYHTNVKYEPWTPSKDFLTQLRQEIMDGRSPIFQKLLDADLTANGRTEKLDQINENRQKKQEHQQQGQEQPKEQRKNRRR